jgi:hypothetical protein
VVVATAVQVKTTEDDTEPSDATLAVVDEQVNPVGTISADVVFELTIVAIAIQPTVPQE